MFDKDDDDIIEQMILSGAVEISGIDMATGEPLYTFTEKIAQFSPEIHKAMTNYFYSEMMFLWENGFIEMDVTVSNPVVRLTEKAFDETKTRSLAPDHLESLNEIIRKMMTEQ